MDRMAILHQMLQAQPGDAFLQHALALEYIKKGDEDTARRLFEKIVRENENYVGSYYQLAQLLERTGQTAAAIQVYEKGMQQAKKLGEDHAYRELLAAYEELTF